jgi:hypothetical protein
MPPDLRIASTSFSITLAARRLRAKGYLTAKMPVDEIRIADFSRIASGQVGSGKVWLAAKNPGIRPGDPAP